jgi:hypothetical protein
MFGRRRTGVIAVACSAIAVTAGVFGAASSAQTADRPVISGDPLVGSVLSAPAGFSIYQWQGCDPDVADCSDSPSFSDSNWFDLTGKSHDFQTYTVAPSDAGNFIRLLVHANNKGDHWVTSAPVGPVPEPTAPPPGISAQNGTVEPEHGISLLVEPTGGTVLVKLPGQSGFSPLDGLQKIPVNSVLDTRSGKARVTAATGNLGDTTEDNSVDFYEGLIRLQQSAATDAPTVGKLVQKLRCGKGKAKGARASAAGGPLAAASGSRSRHVWGSGHGSYGSRGSGGTGSVRGTTWLTKDTCKGTFFKVTEGIGIAVLDFDLHKTVELGPGQSYFARNR